MKCKYLVLAGVSLLLPVILTAQILGIPGVPQIVFDPTSAADIMKDVQQSILLYQMATATYNQIAANAMWAGNKRAWLGIATEVMNSQTGTIFGETGGWNPAVTQDAGVIGAWQQATYRMTPAPFYNLFPIGNSSVSANIASVEIADGMSQAAMATVADSRMNQPVNDLALTNLEATAQDAGAGTNSEVEQLNVIANGSVLQNRQIENQAALLTTIAEQQLLANKVQRDQISAAINRQSTWDNYTANEPAQWGNSAATIANLLQ